MSETLYDIMDIGVDPVLDSPPENCSPDEIFKYLSNYIRHYHPNMDLEKLNTAYEIAYKAHDGQKRKSGEPYITHPLRVACILAALELDKESIIAGLLHDVVEDTEYTLKDIEDLFGSDVATLVDGVTKLGQVSIKQDKIEVQAENLRKMFLAMAKDIRVILIKLADRLHNMRTLQHMRREKQIEIAKETQDIYAPLAHRLGIFKIKVELDDLSLRYLEPEIYFNLMGQLNQRESSRHEYISNIVNEVKEYMLKSEIKCKIYGRVKHIFSIYKKMLKQNKSLDQIYDLFAIRIIVDDIKDCYAALGIIHDIYKPIPGRFKDYIAVPKPNMYRSLHTTVIGNGALPFEIQIRTEEMHKTAEYGIAAHWVYKEGKSGVKQDKMDAKLSWLRQLLEWQQEMPDNLEFINSVKEDLNLFSENIYCFTPGGDVKTLKAGSTPIDFAYSIHSAVGNRMVGARVNSKMVPIDTKLKNGDRIEIITSQNSRGPSLDWLNVVVTTQAKNKIQQWFKKTNKEENINKGKDLINAYAKAHNYNLSELMKNKYLEALYLRYNLKDWDAILAAVGHGGLKEGAVFTKLLDEYKKDNKNEEKSDNQVLENIQKTKHVKSNGSNSAIQVKGVNDISVRLSKCCNPVPGDEIVGFITRGRGVSVHRSDCINVINMSDFDKERLIETEWSIDSNSADSNFVASIDIYMSNQKGMLTKITRMLTENDIDIVSMNVRTSKNGEAAVETEFYINNKYGLSKIIEKLRSISGVIDVERVG